MNDDRRSFEASLRVLAEEARGGLREHPSPADLAAFQAGALSRDAADGVEEHLAACPGCTRYFLDLAALSDGRVEGREGERLSDEEVAADWEAIRRRIDEPAAAAPVEPGMASGDIARGDSAEESPPAAPPPVADRDTWYRTVPPLRLLAAGLAVAALALGAWSYSLLREAREIRADVQIVSLLPRGEGVRGGGEEHQISAGTGPSVLVLTRFGEEDYPDHALEIVEAGEETGRLIWRADGLELQREGSSRILAIQLPAGSLPPGRYVLRLFGLGQGERRLLAVYDLSVG